jgi:hypothetical protein
MSDPSLPNDPAPASELTRRPQPDGAHPERIPPTDHRVFMKLRPGTPLPPGIAPDAQRYSPAVIEEARAGKEAVKRLVPDADGEFVEAPRELLAELDAPKPYSVPTRIFIGAFALAIGALLFSNPIVSSLGVIIQVIIQLCIVYFVAMLTYGVVTGKDPGVDYRVSSPSFLRLADPSVPLNDDDPISRPPGGTLERLSSRAGPPDGNAPSSRA